MSDSDSIFDDADLIFAYTAEDAVADGVLINAREGDIAEVTGQHIRAELPVFISHGLHSLIQTAVDNPHAYNDWRGVWHDVLTMWRHAVRRKPRDDCFIAFEVHITGAGPNDEHRIFAILDGAGLTFMLPSDY